MCNQTEILNNLQKSNEENHKIQNSECEHQCVKVSGSWKQCEAVCCVVSRCGDLRADVIVGEIEACERAQSGDLLGECFDLVVSEF